MWVPLCIERFKIARFFICMQVEDEVEENESGGEEEDKEDGEGDKGEEDQEGEKKAEEVG